MSIWIEPETVRPSAALQEVAGHPLLAQVLARRGLGHPAAARAFIDPDAYRPAPASELPDLPTAAVRLAAAIEAGERILVWGDFDVDGQTATSLLVGGLRDLGGRVEAHIPHRLHEGHGITLPSLGRFLPQTDLLLTCDTGVSEHEAIAHARAQGVTVLVTDHHDLPPTLPEADAVVDPKRLPPSHPLYALPGVGVAYKLMEALYARLGSLAQPLESALDLVALGIVADVATQVGDTRYLLQRGMQRLRQTQRLGLQVLMGVAQVKPANLTTDHIGFQLGPRLNALGRLGDANLAVDLLTTKDLTRARILANQLEALNGRRQILTAQITAAAQEQIANDPALLDGHALVLSGPRWHPGVIGIVASRLAETYDQPTVLISEGEDGLGRGSARSVVGVDIHAAITAVEGLLMTHGGHPGAAGLSLEVDNIPRFRRALSRAVDEIWDREAEPGLAIDALVDWQAPSLELVDLLRRLAPFGEGNPPILLASHDLELVSERIFGRDQAHRRLGVRDAQGTTRDVIWWRGAEHAPPEGRFDLAYVLKASDYRGDTSLQIEYVDARIVVAPPVSVAKPLQIVDYRRAVDPASLLRAFQASREGVTWAEGYPVDRSPGLRRDQLGPAAMLAIWTPPAGPRELQAALEVVSPERVLLFAVPGEGADPHRFLPRLGGMIRYALRRQGGVVDLPRLAAASGQRAETVRAGIRLLEARGDVKIQEEGETELLVAGGDGLEKRGLEEILAHLQALLQETAAYRVYFARAAPGRLLDR